MSYQCKTPDCALHLSGAAFPAPMPCPVCQASLVEVKVTDEPSAGRSDFEQRVLDRYPYVIALPYRNMLDEQDGRGRLDLLAYTLQNALKYMGLLVVGEYHASDLRLPQLNELFKHNLYQPSFGNWNQFLREGIAALEKEGHSWVLPEIKEGYAAIETAKRCKKYPVETAYTDEEGQMAYRTIQGTAIGTLINFRNRHLGHGTPLNKAKAEELYGQFKPILDDLLEGLAFSEALTMVRAERNELYRLMGCAPEPIMGRTPEKEDQSKVWLEREDGRRLELMPFFILPGQVAGADSGSGVLVYEQFTGGKRIVFHGPDNSHGESVGEVLDRLKSMIYLKEEEPPITAEEMTEAVFCQRLAQWNEAVMAGLHRERKVIPNLYQPRVAAEQELKGWIGAQAPLLVIAAEAGSGKTNLLAEMARQYGELELPSVLIRAVRMESPDLEEALRRVLNVATDADVAALPVLNRPVDAPLMILVDGGNEHGDPHVLMAHLLSFLERTPAGVKVVLSWRVDTPADLPILDEQQARLVYPAAQRAGDHILAKSALRLGALDRQEIEGAWSRYFAHPSKSYRPQFDFQKLVEVDRPLTEQFANPLLLRMFMELFHQRGLKYKPKGMADIWALWWRDQGTREREADFLEALATLLMKTGESKVSLDALFDHDTLSPEVRNIQVDSAYQQLLRSGVLSQSFAGEELEVGFTMEAAWIFVLGEIAGREEWTAEKVADRLADSPRWRAPLKSMVRARVGRGGLDLLCDCIDNERVPDEFSAEALAQAFLLRNPAKVIEAVLADATASDWEVIRMAVDWLTEGQMVAKSADVCSAVVPFLKGAPISAEFIGALFMRANHFEKQVMIEILESLMGSLDSPSEWGHAGMVFRYAGDYARALECHERALELVLEIEGRDSAAYADLSCSIASTLDKAGRYEEAIIHCNEALRVEELLYGPDSEKVAGSYYRMGWILNMQDKQVEAVEWMLKALTIEEKTLGIWHKSTAATLAGLCSAYRGIGKLKLAMDHAKRGHAIEERIYPKGAYSLGINHYNIGRILLEMGESKDALTQFLEGAAILESALGPKHRNTLRNRTFTGMALGACGRLEEARAFLQKTLQWQQEGQVRPGDIQATAKALETLSPN